METVPVWGSGSVRRPATTESVARSGDWPQLVADLTTAMAIDGDPRIVSSLAGDENSARFQGSGGDDQVGITKRPSAATGDGPKIFGTIQDAVGDWNDHRVIDRLDFFVRLPPRLFGPIPDHSCRHLIARFSGVRSAGVHDGNESRVFVRGHPDRGKPGGVAACVS